MPMPEQGLDLQEDATHLLQGRIRKQDEGGLLFTPEFVGVKSVDLTTVHQHALGLVGCRDIQQISGDGPETGSWEGNAQQGRDEGGDLDLVDTIKLEMRQWPMGALPGGDRSIINAKTKVFGIGLALG